MNKTFLAGALLAFSTPVFAQESTATLPVDCFQELGGADLARDMTDDYLKDSGIGEGPAMPVQERLDAVAGACSDRHGVEGEQARPFFMANLGYLVSEDLEQRLIELGFDMGPLDEATALLVADPDFALGEYIDARPEIYANPAEQIAERHGLTFDETVALIGGYIGIRALQLNNAALLEAS